MKLFFASILMAVSFGVIAQSSNPVLIRKGLLGRVEYTGSNPLWNSTGAYFSSEKNSKLPLIQKINFYINNRHWQLFRELFTTEIAYEDFVKQLSYTNKELLELEKNNDNHSILNKIKPWRIKTISGNSFELQTVNGLEKATITFMLSEDKIEKATITKSRLAQKTGTNGASWNFVQLAKINSSNEEIEYPIYYDDYLEYYSKTKSVESSSSGDFPFGQINFEPLEFKYKKCTFGGSVCQNGVFKYELGSVISDKDMPENQMGYTKKYFRQITDMTAFVTPFSADYLLFDSYTLTAVVVDKGKKQLTFIRDGLEPWLYGLGSEDVHFENPVAIEEIDQFLYVLDAGTNPVIHVFKINHSVNGDFNVEHIGAIDSISFNNPRDIAGYEKTSLNILYVATIDGLYSFEINKSTGLANGNYHLFESGIDPNNSQTQIPFSTVKRVGTDAESGSTILITYSNDVISFSNNVNGSGLSVIPLNFRTVLSPKLYPNNLAYMRFEEKWYITDDAGKMHTLDKNGRYIGGGGVFGDSEWGGELYYPKAITPNKIADPTNDYRYRYIVANTYGWETGFKLFAPRVVIPDFEVFENLNNDELTFTFTTSGKWQHVEKGTGITFSGLKINGTAIATSLWNTQIQAGTVENPGDQLNDKINEILLQPAQLTTLRRGWNKAEITITIFKKDGNHELVKKEIDFYWLPTNYNAGAQAGGPFANNNWQLNLYSTIENEKIDFIYKDISLLNVASLYGVDRQVIFMPLCTLTVNGGNTVYNNSPGYDPLDNFSFGEGSLIDVKDNGYICLNVDRTSFDISQKNYQSNLKLAEGYKLGVFPDGIPEYASAACKSPCEIMEARSPLFDFKLDIDRTGLSPQLLITPNTTYREALHINLLNKATNTSASRPLYEDNLPSTMNVSTDIFSGYPFDPCTEYEITLSMGCNGYEWPISKTKSTNTSAKIDAGKDMAFCYETTGSVQLEATEPEIGGFWSSNDLVISQNGQINYSEFSAGTNYTLLYSFTDEWNCTVTDEKVVSMKPQLPQLSLTTDPSICEEGEITLTANELEDIVYVWTLPSSERLATSVNTLTLDNFSSANIGDYTVAIYSDGCEGTASQPFTVGIYPKTVVDAGSDVDLCVAETTYTFNSGVPTGGIWSGDEVADGQFEPSLAGSGLHQVTYTFTNQYNCAYSDVLEITVGPQHPMPEGLELCITDNPLDLLQLVPNSSNWVGQGIVADIFTPTNAGEGLKTVSFDYLNNGCTSHFELDIQVKSGPLSIVTGPATALCADELAQLSVSEYPNASYSWVGPNGFTSGMPKPIVFGDKSLISGNYTVTVTIDGCSAQGLANVSFLEKATFSLATPTIVCISDLPLPLSATPTGGTWSGRGVMEDGSNYTLNSEEGAGVYTLFYKWTDENQCENHEYVFINVKTTPLAIVDMSKLRGSCYNEVDEYQLFATVVNPQQETFKWYRAGIELAGETTQALYVDDVASYTLEMTNSCGTRTQTYTPPLNISPIFSAIPSSFVCDAGCTETIVVNVENLQLGHNYEFKLFKNDELVQELEVDSVTTSDATQTFAVNGFGSYTVSVKNKNDFGVCEVSKEVTIDRKQVAQEGRYFSFNEADRAYAPHIDAYDFHKGPHTFEAWIQIPEGYVVDPTILFENYSEYPGYLPMLTIMGTSTNFDSYSNDLFSDHSDNNNWGFMFGVNKDGGLTLRYEHDKRDVECNLLDGKCHHVAVVRESLIWDEGGNGAWSNSLYNRHNYYIDGNLIATFERDLMQSGRSGIRELKDGDLFLGFSSDHSYRGFPFEGLIKEARIWNVVRTTEQIQNNYKYPLAGNEEGLVGYWKFDETNDSQIITDYSVNANHAVLGKTTNVETQDPAYHTGCEASCVQVEELESSDITKYTAIVKWQGEASGNYLLRYRIEGDDWGQPQSVQGTTSALTALAVGTHYEWQVLTQCAEGSSVVEWSAIQHFQTLGKTCAKPTNLWSKVYSDNAVELKWVDDENSGSYKVRYRVQGTTGWVFQTVNDKRLVILGSQLATATTYQWSVVGQCVNNQSSIAPLATFYTNQQAVCSPPANLTVTDISGTSARLNWTGSPGQDYRIRYALHMVSDPWKYVSPNKQNSVMIYNLQPASHYRWQIVTMCSDGSLNPVSYTTLTGFFTTAGQVCPIPVGLSTTRAVDNTTTVSWNAVPNGVKYNVGYNNTINNTWTYKETTNATYIIPGTQLLPNAAYRWNVMAFCQTNVGKRSGNVFFNTGLGTGTREAFATDASLEELLVEVSPNPFEESIKVSIHQCAGEVAQIALIDLNGVVLENKTYAGSGEYEIESNVSAGVYYLKVTGCGKTQIIKVVKL